MHFSSATSPFIISFVLIFVAELGDKTLYTILLLASRHRAIPVLIGSFAAFLVQGTIALLLGSILGLLPPMLIRWITALIFAFFGIKLLVSKDEKEDESKERDDGKRLALTSFLMVMAAEWGDASQIGTAALVARLRAPFLVFLGATAGLWTGTVLAVTVGRMIGSKIPAHWLRRGAGVLFCAFALLTAIRG